jgi:hypothetical protein
MTIVALLAMNFVCSCSKEDDKENGLTGTSWKATDPDTNAELVFLFQTEKTVRITPLDGSFSINGTYTYKDPNITITFVVEDEDGDGTTVFSGKVNGNTMTLTNQDDETIILHKQ